MDKKQFLVLKNGSTVSFNGTELGYTNGIRLTPQFTVFELDNQKIGKVSSETHITSVEVEVNIYEWNTNNIGLLQDGNLSGKLVICGETFSSTNKYRKITVYNAYRTNIGAVELGKLPVPTTLTFTGYVDETTGKVYIVETTGK